MHQKTKDIQKRYEGFLQTPSLWMSNSIFNLEQFEIDNNSSKINMPIDEKLRLGKYIERFVSFQLQQKNDISILCDNIQIQQEKRTLGELDCILKKRNSIIHLEIIYKFYLYDESFGTNEIEHCIGPNRKDSLVEKLTKLKEKQLPLLYSKECNDFLKTIELSPSKIKQQVYFKTQLFVPLSKQNILFKELNNDCICGFYVNLKELDQFINCKFYIPIKKNWLVIPHQNVDWLNFLHFKENAQEHLNRKFSPLCWIKKANGEMLKFFLVWWDCY